MKNVIEKCKTIKNDRELGGILRDLILYQNADVPPYIVELCKTIHNDEDLGIKLKILKYDNNQL